MKISQILDKIDENQLFVPAFQREYVWKRNHAKNLIDSLIRDYPTGTMLTWETNHPPELKGKHKYHEEQGAIKLILDGQQRITTLYMLVRGKFPPYYTEEEIKTDIRNLYVHAETLELQYYKKITMKNNPLWINLTDIFQKKIKARNVYKELQKTEDVSEEREDRIDENFTAIEKIPDRDFLEQTIPVKAKIKEAIDIFYVVNASGVNLTEAELALAQISGYWPEARDRFKEKLSALEKEGFVFKLDFIIYVILGCLYHTGSDMGKLHGEENKTKINEAWELLDSYTLDYVMNIMRANAYIDHTDEINSVYALIPIIVYTFDKGKQSLSQDEINRAKKWFYYSQIRSRYTSQIQTKLSKDLEIVQKSEQPFDELLRVIESEGRLQIISEEFVGASIRNALWGLMRWYFKSRDAVCLTTGVSIRRNMGKIYSLEWDHIFPYSRLKEIGYITENKVKYQLAQEITNRAVLTQKANRSKSNMAAKDYLVEVNEKFPDALELQSIPTHDENLWLRERYEDFLEERRKLLTSQLNKFLENITVSRKAQVEISLEEMIQEGESDELEFKSSLRWSYKEGRIDKALEQVIIKSVAAFSNADGGLLLVGIDDNGNSLGLEHDYSSLNGTKDEFEQHLRNLLGTAFGVTFTVNLTMNFPEIDGYEICRIDIPRGKNPVYLGVKDKNGQKQEKFYVRSGNSSQEVPLTEIHDYIRQRFPTGSTRQ